jgi:transposase
MRKLSNICWDDYHFNIIKKQRLQHPPVTFDTIAKTFGTTAITARMIRHQFALGPPSKRVRKVDLSIKAKMERRVVKVKKLAKELVKVTQPHSGKQYNTAWVPKHPTCRSIANALVGDRGEKLSKISAECVRGYLSKGGMRAYHQPDTIMVTDTSKTKRMKFAKKMMRHPKRKKIFFSDETLIDRNARGRKFQWAETRAKAQAIKAFNRNGPKVMLWAMIGRDYKSRLVAFGGKALNHQDYIDGCLTKKFGNVVKKKGGLFMQDNAPIHKSKKVMGHIRTKLQMPLLEDWPPYSPDLNPIEMAWAMLKRKVAVRRDILTQEQLVAACKQAWDRIPIAVINKLIDKFEGRLQAVLASKGEIVK